MNLNLFKRWINKVLDCLVDEYKRIHKIFAQEVPLPPNLNISDLERERHFTAGREFRENTGT